MTPVLGAIALVGGIVLLVDGGKKEWRQIRFERVIVLYAAKQKWLVSTEHPPGNSFPHANI